MTNPAESSPAPLSSNRDLRPTAQPQGHRVKFDATVSLGHILTFVSLLLAGFSAYNTMDKRIVVLEEQRRAESERSTEIDKRLNGVLTEVRSDVKELQRSLNEIARNIVIRK